MTYKSAELHAFLQKHLGFDKFKDQQEVIIQNVLQRRDTFVIMPTGGGKSLCYQLPAIMMEGTAIVISPLIALMKNQVDSIRGYSQNNSIAHFLNSSLNKTQIKEVKKDIVDGKTKLLFVAPETLTKDENIAFFKEVKISFIAVDEAHCISEWGHDFRPEYRRIKHMIREIGEDTPLMALTATATPKVQSDIIKNLELDLEKTFMSSFNRDNLFYEVRPKTSKDQTLKSIVQFIKKTKGQSGIVYVQSRKSTEEVAKVLSVNGVKAAPYHAGLEAKVRARIQDEFLMEKTDVICATIAFGMGIDKPDVRFVIHYDIPKSIENYYQETGRAGRDGLQSHCLTFYSHKDILKLEKFLKDKPVSERELSAQLMEEMIAYAETSSCRRQFLLHYFGEQFAEEDCNCLCDNCKNPKEREEVSRELKMALEAVIELKERMGIKTLVEFVFGKHTKEVKDFRYDKLEGFAKGKDRSELFWHSMFRQAILHDYIRKDIEEYGVIKMTDKGKDFVKSPQKFEVSINHDYSALGEEEVITNANAQGGALDNVLLDILKDLRRKEAERLKVKPWIVFLDPSLNDMATYYPISMEDMINISGVNKGKAERYGRPFVEVIKDYVEENEIERPDDFVVKQVANKSKAKVSIIQGIDRKFTLEEIANNSKMSMDELLDEMEMIVYSGTKLNIDYYLEDNVDEYTLEDIYDYFNEAETDSVKDAYDELQEDDISMEEIKMVKIKFISEMAN